MSQTALRRSLAATQSRRKLRIRLAILFLSPLLLLATGPWEPGSWQRRSMEDIGVLLIFVAILGRAWSILYIGGRKTRDLVATGPYSVTRNPLYFFSFMALAGLGAQTGSFAIILVLLAAAWAIFLPVVHREEAALGEAHGRRFETYRASVPRFLPNPRLWTNAGEIRVDPAIWARTVLDSSFFLLLVPLIRGIGWMQFSLFGPHLILLF
ncbi:methyltransferase family protein [Aureimonas populi]|uniref:Methyltransferase family protein n=1 Tax=Aureimonas populi TaxID=1701758 RepID=A0ABW5CPA4_9HYPH|nr:isoprenylcysteine carboxylmethyltransferase family protein [Aureimonas populi]